MSICKKVINLDDLCVAPNARKVVSFRTLQQQYGDGYMARRQDGINPVNYTWDVSTPPMPTDEALDFEAELITNGEGFFEWTPPNETKQNFILDPVEWSWTWIDPENAAISFTLRRWYQ